MWNKVMIEEFLKIWMNTVKKLFQTHILPYK